MKTQRLGTNISYSHLATFLFYFTNSPFFGEKCTLLHILDNKQNSSPHPFCNVEEIQLWLIKTTCVTNLLLQVKPEIIKTFNFKFENVSFTKLPNFDFILRNHILTQHSWKNFIMWYSLEYSIMLMFDYLTKISIINLKEFTVYSINYLGWE